MPHNHRDELSRLDDIESLMTTARDLALRFNGPELHETARTIQSSLEELKNARSSIIDGWRGGRL